MDKYHKFIKHSQYLVVLKRPSIKFYKNQNLPRKSPPPPIFFQEFLIPDLLKSYSNIVIRLSEYFLHNLWTILIIIIKKKYKTCCYTPDNKLQSHGEFPNHPAWRRSELPRTFRNSPKRGGWDFSITNAEAGPQLFPLSEHFCACASVVKSTRYSQFIILPGRGICFES